MANLQFNHLIPCVIEQIQQEYGLKAKKIKYFEAFKTKV